MSKPNAPLSLEAQLAALKAENEALKAQQAQKVTLKVGPAGGVSVYGMGRFPVTLFQEQWLTLLGMSETIKGFIAANAPLLNAKADDEATLAAKAKLRASKGIVAKDPKADEKPKTATAVPPVTRYSAR